MAKRIKIEMNGAGIRGLLQSDSIREDLQRRADNIAAAAGPGFIARSSIGTHRARAQVITDNFEGRLAEAQDQVLTRAIDAGRA